MKWLLGILGLALIVIWMRLLSSDGGLVQVMTLNQELSSMQAQLDELSAENTLLKREIIDLQTNTQAIETIARHKLGMIGQDEVFVKVIELPAGDQNDAKPGEGASGTVSER
ncbi:septum formation initiator family protein [Thiomicrospira sp. WB1]|uniref:FtsB family cell division protein n=1 Tax=Thiomicrospira sp. WB1 TaxID=1685380 RepID=UPI0007462FA2|nr:septum formation initiator family protein [Thiomicrospira sp. WB1]KUJ72082.1 septum formation initiator [Thiomicrospira sp. WB1]